nr:CAP domain-containing protein [uncultured Agathobaculum sp.]
MQMHKIAPLALAALLAAGVSAAAADTPEAAQRMGTAACLYQTSGQRPSGWDCVRPVLPPSCGTPDTDKPDTDLPDVEIPDVEIPDIELPDADLPDVEFPDADIPDAEQPDAGLPDQTPDSTPDSTPEAPEQDENDPQGDYAAQVVALVNAERAKYGLSALQTDSRVQQAAQVRAAETVQSFSHTRPNGSSFSTALTEAGVSYTRSGENIAYGQSTPQQVVQAWMNSDGHRANILNGSFTTIGVGYTVVNGTAYWAQLFTA